MSKSLPRLGAKVQAMYFAGSLGTVLGNGTVIARHDADERRSPGITVEFTDGERRDFSVTTRGQYWDTIK